MEIKKKIIEEITITGDVQELDTINAFLDDGNWRVIFQGPPVIKFPRVDASKIQIVAKREITEEY